MKNIYVEAGLRPIKAWTTDIDDAALAQARNLARLPFIAPNGVALMPDCHLGMGSTVGTVIATDRVGIPEHRDRRFRTIVTGHSGSS